ncbi:MAG: hypothetical protein MUE81_13330 [Thermoflexibacter sp.]|nr:hypothetical protein [Thermoflexibacter sp.]
MKKEELLKSVSSIPAKALKNTGKIWIYDKYLLVNELNKGVHVIDNSNPNFPRQVSFIQIPANVDMAVKGRILYADSHTNLLAIDISNPLQIKILEVVENAFPPLYFHSDTTKGIIVDWEEKEITEIVDCNYQPCPNCFYFDRAFANSSGGKSAAPSSNVSKGGSMARFTLNDDYLYTVNENSLKLFEITNPAKPKPTIDIPIGWGIETIFPYNDKLFIGSMTGMHIFDNSNPAKPEFLSTYSHVTSCDPVVVEGDYAYVTLRTEDSGTGLRRCVRGVNVLDVVDISNPKRPILVKSYPMLNPHGVGIDKQNLFVCEGKHGLKYFRATDVQTIDKNLLNHLQGFDAYDVIPYDNLLIMVGKNGIYQFDYASKKELKLLSMLPVVQD